MDVCRVCCGPNANAAGLVPAIGGERQEETHGPVYKVQGPGGPNQLTAMSANCLLRLTRTTSETVHGRHTPLTLKVKVN